MEMQQYVVLYVFLSYISLQRYKDINVAQKYLYGEFMSLAIVKHTYFYM